MSAFGTADAVPERAARITLLVLDVDGVLTDGHIVYADDGREIKSFHVRDGAALHYWQKSGRQAAVISGRSSNATLKRTGELGIAHVYQGAGTKLVCLRDLLAKTGVPPEQVCAIGDDLPDIPVLRAVGLGVAVADACAETRAAAHWVLRSAGGQGAVRELIEMLMKAQGTWASVLDELHRQRL